MKTTVVKVTAKDGQVFFPNDNLGSDGKAYGKYRVEQKILDFQGGFTSVKKRSDFIAMSLVDFEKAKDILVEGLEIEGKIVRKVTMTPQYEGHKPQQVPVYDNDNKVEKWIPVTAGGSPTYLTDRFTTNLEEKDQLLSISYDKIEIAKTATSKEGVEKQVALA